MAEQIAPGDGAGQVGDDAVLTAELWLDIGCPWCYLGFRRLDRAIEAVAADGEVRVVLRSFELNPGMSRQSVPVVEYLAKAVAGSVERAREMDGTVAALAAEEGLPYTSQRPIANTFDVHRVLHLTRQHGVANQVFRGLQGGYFAGELDPFDHETLVKVSEQAGVPAEQTREVLSGGGYAEAVRHEQAVGRALGITGVPFTVVGEKYAVSGAQSVEVYTETIRRVRAERG